jgi:hypothetical protein
MRIATVGIDLARNLFPVQAVDARGRDMLRKQLRRYQMTARSHWLRMGGASRCSTKAGPANTRAAPVRADWSSAQARSHGLA